MNNYPLFHMRCSYTVDGRKQVKNESYFIIDFYKEEEVLKFSCIKGYPRAKEGRHDVTNEDIINYCNNPLSERKVISSEECIRGSHRFLECELIMPNDNESLKRIAVKMNSQGITEDDFKKLSIFENITETSLEELRKIREELKEGD